MPFVPSLTFSTPLTLLPLSQRRAHDEPLNHATSVPSKSFSTSLSNSLVLMTLKLGLIQQSALSSPTSRLPDTGRGNHTVF